MEQTQKETDEEIKLLRIAIADLSIKLGFIEDPKTGEKSLDSDIDYIKGLKAYNSLIASLRSVRAMRYRVLEQPDKRNDKQEIETIDDTPKPLSEIFKNSSTITLLDTVDFNDDT